MLEITFIESPDTVYQGSFSRIGEHLVSLTGVPATEGGFYVSRVGKDDKWNYSEFTTIYRISGNVIFFSNDGSIYKEPTVEIKGSIIWNDAEDEDKLRPSSIIITSSDGDTQTATSENNWEFDFGEKEEKLNITLSIPAMEDYEIVNSDYDFMCSHITINTVKEQKISELNEMQQQLIKAGTDVTLTDGTIEHFSLSDQDQISLEGLATLIATGVEYIPWHTSNHDEPCKYYTATDMSLIIQGAMSCVTYHVTYFRDLRRYVNSLTSKEDIENVEYGIEIPQEFQSAVLQQILASQQ